ncbi:hypothetical protein F5050DRAFT_1857462 [Lentinula boryana]|uniref:Uncharacterized protein n=1 Tax=Lentinula boryana TaxID=40481 RepID=A0ABQ8Q0R3_9AGAR|nr:hypothetical protein F5050DRAFT_1857462 [Lentinula boryana]
MMGDSPSLYKRKNPPDPGRDTETTPKGTRTKSIHTLSPRSPSPTPLSYKNSAAERAASRRDGRFDPIKLTTPSTTGIPRRNEKNPTTAASSGRNGRESQLSTYSEPGPMDQDQEWYQDDYQGDRGHLTTHTWNTAPQNEPGLLTAKIFFAMDQLVLDLRKAIQEGSLPSNFDEQIGQTGAQLVNILSQIGVKGEQESNDKLSRAITKLTESFAEARRTDSARLTEIEKRLQIEKTANTKPNWAAESYAARATVGANQTTRTSNANKRNYEKPGKEEERTAQFVVHFGEMVPEETRKDPYSITRDINSFIERHLNLGKTRVATAKWNVNGNLVITTLAGQSAGPLEPFFGDLHEFYTTTALTPQDTKLNQVWYKVIIDGVSTGTQWRLNSGIAPRPHNSAELKEELVLYNPALTGVEFALDPRFVVPATELTHKRESSIQFAVTDHQTADNIIKNKTLNLFGKACKTRRYQDRRPSSPQCRKCKGLGHKEDKCKTQLRCALCGGDHTETQHTLQCGSCKANPRYIEGDFDKDAIEKGIIGQCTHNLRCVNCSEKSLEATHSATSRNCPERIRAMGSTRDVNRTQAQGKGTTDQFQNVQKKRTKPKKVATMTATPKGGAQSRFDVLDPSGDIENNTGEDLNMEMRHD